MAPWAGRKLLVDLREHVDRARHRVARRGARASTRCGRSRRRPELEQVHALVREHVPPPSRTTIGSTATSQTLAALVTRRHPGRASCGNAVVRGGCSSSSPASRVIALLLAWSRWLAGRSAGRAAGTPGSRRRRRLGSPPGALVGDGQLSCPTSRLVRDSPSRSCSSSRSAPGRYPRDPDATAGRPQMQVFELTGDQWRLEAQDPGLAGPRRRHSGWITCYRIERLSTRRRPRRSDAGTGSDAAGNVALCPGL